LVCNLSQVFYKAKVLGCRIHLRIMTQVKSSLRLCG
jgi:hypothetical protein